MSITITKLDNPYDVKFELSFCRYDFIGKCDIISGVILIDGIEHYLDVISKDIVDLLAEMTDKSIANLVPKNIPKSIDNIHERYRLPALEVKLKLMACDGLRKMDNVNKRKLEAIERYRKMREDEENKHNERIMAEERRYESAMINIEKQFHSELGWQ